MSSRRTLVPVLTALLGLVVYLSWQVPDVPARMPSDASATAPEAEQARSAADPLAPVDRVAAAAAPAPGESPAAPAAFDLILEVLVLDTLGLPYEGYRPELGPAGGALRGADGVSDAHGRLTVHVPCRAPTATIDLLEPRGLRRRLALQAGAPRRATLLHDAPDYARGRGPTFSFTMNAAESPRDARTLGSPMRSRRMQPGIDPRTVFSERGIVLPPDPSAPAPQSSQTLSLGALTSGTLRLGGEGGAILFGSKGQVSLDGWSGSLEQLLRDRAVEQLPSESPVAIRGAVFAVDGAAAAEAPVGLYRDGPQPVARALTDAQGRYLFEDVAPGTYEVRAGGGPGGMSSGQVLVEGGAYDVNLRYARGVTITGWLRDGVGAPVAGARVEWRASTAEFVVEGRTGEDGAFVLANLPQSVGRLLAFGGQGSNRLPVAILEGVVAGSADVELVASSQATGLQFRPAAPPELGAGGLRARIHQVATGLVQQVSAPQKSPVVDAAWSHAGLPAGLYEVEVSRAGCGGWQSGPCVTTVDAILDLGLASLSAPGVVRFELPDGPVPEALAVEIVGQRGGHDVRQEVLRRLGGELWIAPGAYRLLWKLGDGEVATAPFQVESGGVQVLRLAW